MGMKCRGSTGKTFTLLEKSGWIKSYRILQTCQVVWNKQGFLKEREEVSMEKREGKVFLAEEAK